jgi:iron complex outermembrane receptor protein
MRQLVAAIVIGSCLAGQARPAAAQGGTADLKRMSLEDLLDLQITTVSKRPEPTSDVPAAVFVITQDDIRRSGATSLPEALRLAPGIQVAQMDGGKWATGVRGFSDRLSRAMLVLIDGRSVYSPLFAGTYWEVQDVMLEDVERIEVTRGPGGTLWGANAVNGIINIVTMAAARTQGTLASVEAGGYGHAGGAFRFGGQADQGAFNYRIYGKGVQLEHQKRSSASVEDQAARVQVGGRADWNLPGQRLFTLQGDAYRERLGETAQQSFYTAPFQTVAPVEAPLSGGNVLGRISGGLGQHADFQLQAYYDRSTRDEVPVGEQRDTVDVDYQQTQHQWPRHQVTFGGGYRVSTGRITAVSTSAFTPGTRTDNLFSAFAQDEITLVHDRLRASVGAKVEHNAYSGVELQPSVRLLWTLSPRHSLIGSVTRAVRTPSRVETDYSTTTLASPNGPVFVRLVPNPDFVSEELVASELGYRVRPIAPVYLTVSGFYNALDHILSTDLATPYVEGTAPAARIILPVTFGNGLHGESHGLEATADVRPRAWLRTTANYSYLKVSVSRNPGSTDVSQEARYEGITPRHQVQAQVALDLSRRVTADWMVRHASRLAQGPVPAYTTSTVRVGWRLTPALELSLVGDNLNRATHLEWPGGEPVQRSGYVKLTWRR